MKKKTKINNLEIQPEERKLWKKNIFAKGHLKDLLEIKLKKSKWGKNILSEFKIVIKTSIKDLR